MAFWSNSTCKSDLSVCKTAAVAATETVSDTCPTSSLTSRRVTVLMVISIPVWVYLRNPAAATVSS